MPKALPHQLIEGIEHKFCPGCQDWKVLDDFSERTRSSDGKAPRCRECVSRYLREMKSKHAAAGFVARSIIKPGTRYVAAANLANGRKAKARLYDVWTSMRMRCSRPSCKDYVRYGARGIRVCEEWDNDYHAFRAWAMASGFRKGLTLDRIDSDGNYEPANCRWVTKAAQQFNTRRTHQLTINGVTRSLPEWSRIYGIRATVINSRIRLGWDHYQAVTIPPGQPRALRSVSAALTRPVLRYHGGKFRLAPWILSFFPPHRVYVEPFGGAASVLMRKERSFAEVYNDRWGVVVNVFRVLRDPAQASRLERALRLTPFARDEFEAEWPDENGDPVERARMAILRSFAGFGSAATNGEYATGFRANSNRSNTTPAHDWVNYPSHIERFTSRLAGVVIENRPAEQVIRTHDSPDTLHYVDPPYPHETRNMRRGNAAYAVEMTTEDHVHLSLTLRECKGMVIVSTYPNDLYDHLYAHWRRETTVALADGARPRREVLYINPACDARQVQQALFRHEYSEES